MLAHDPPRARPERQVLKKDLGVHTMQYYRLCLAILPVLAAPVHALAAGAEAGSAGDEILVTALRAPLPTEKIASSITVLNRETIERSQAPVVTDLLVRTPGISFTRNGGYGTNTSIRIRGAETDQTVLVLDGVKLGDPASTGGGYNFANLLTADAARIEILRGPQSILWGSQAIGGVVNIVTVAPEKPLEGTIDIEGGSRGTVNARAAVGGTSDAIDWRISGNSFTTDGISVRSPRFGGRERDGYTNRTTHGSVRARLTDGVSIDLKGYYSKASADLDGFNADSPEFSSNEEWIGYAGLNADLLDGKLHNRVSFSQGEVKRENIDPRLGLEQRTFDALGRTRRYEYQGTLTLSDGLNAVFGAEREEQRMRSASPAYGPTVVRGKADIDSLYAQLNGTVIDGLTLSGGLRYDHHSTFGGNTVFGGGASWALFGGNTILRASYGEGFKAPTLYQLFSEYGNQALKPETARGWDAGIEQHLFDRHVQLSATWFDRRTKNLIAFNSCFVASPPALCFVGGSPTPRFGYYDNLQKAHAQGVELAGTATFGGLTIDGNYTWTSAEDRSPGLNFGNQLPRRPKHAANASATYVWPNGVLAGVTLLWSGETLDTVRTSATVAPFVNDDYTLVDIRAEVPLWGQVKLFGRVENLFDEYYETARTYNTLGRSFYAGFRARF